MESRDVINHFLRNPPFDVTDTAKYAEFVSFISNFSLIELSENNSYVDEAKFTTDPPVNPDDVVVFFDLATIVERFMEAIVIEKVEQFPDTVYSAISNAKYGMTGGVSSSALQAAINESSVISLLSIKSYMYIVEEWFKTKVKKIRYRKSEIKLSPNTEYYVLYRRYKTLDEIGMDEIRVFKELFEINLYLSIYQSDTFASEGGLESVSLSGLSVSFNVPDADRKVDTLIKTKSVLLSQIALDYEDMLGII